MCHHGLADVDQLGCTFAQNADTQHFTGLNVEQDLQHARVVADDLPAGDLPIEGLADLIGYALACEFLFIGADHGNLRNRINAVREEFCKGARGFTKSMTGGETALFHGCGGQARKADDIASGVDIVDLGAVVGVDRDPPAIVCGQTGRFQIEVARRTGSTDVLERFLGEDLFAAFQIDPDTGPVLIVATTYAFNTFAET